MYVRVVPLRRTPLTLPWFDYTLPNSLEGVMRVGQLVAIPFRSQKVIGLVIAIHDTAPVAPASLKEIIGLVTAVPIFSQPQLAFFKRVSELYRAPLGWLIKNSLPSLAKKKLASLTPAISLPVDKQLPLPSFRSSHQPEISMYVNDTDKKKTIVSLISKTGQTLLLAPGLKQADELCTLLKTKYAQRLMLFTGNMGTTAQWKVWNTVWSNPDAIVVGTRQALYLPFVALAAVVVDDEANSGHKNTDMAPRTHNRDAALLLAIEHHALLYYAGHTPSVDSYAAGQITQTPPKAANESFNHVLVNMVDERRKKNYHLLSEELAEAVKKNSAGITFLYLNRRGALNYVACRDCGEVEMCPTCKTPLTYHADANNLRCHHCGYACPVALSCPKCQGVTLAMYGSGTQQLEKEVRELADANRIIIRIDSDKELKSQPTFAPGSIVIGTQLAWNSINWSHITAMAFVDADISLFVPEYTVTEELWQRLHEARYRLTATAPLYIQTKHPDHYIFKGLATPQFFYEQELKIRKQFKYPPYTTLLKCFVGCGEPSAARKSAEQAYAELLQLTKRESDITISSPTAFFPAYTRGRYWQIILVRLNPKKWVTQTQLVYNLLPPDWKVDLNPNTILSL